MSTFPAAKTDNAKLYIRPELRRHRFKDENRHTWRLLILREGKVVGVVPGPSGEGHRRHLDARNAARKAACQLRKRRLFVIEVTDKHVTDGEARDCSTCAIAQALWHEMERMGLDRGCERFRVVPYASWTTADGIVLYRYHADPVHIPDDVLPQIVTHYTAWTTQKPAWCAEEMDQWAMDFDEWAESRFMDPAEWREKHGLEEDHEPIRPSPCSFVLDLDAFQPLAD